MWPSEIKEKLYLLSEKYFYQKQEQKTLKSQKNGK